MQESYSITRVGFWYNSYILKNYFQKTFPQFSGKLFTEHMQVIAIASAIRQKDESQRMLQEIKVAKFSEKRTFLTPVNPHVRVRIMGKNVCVSENLMCFIFLQHTF